MKNHGRGDGGSAEDENGRADDELGEKSRKMVTNHSGGGGGLAEPSLNGKNIKKHENERLYAMEWSQGTENARGVTWRTGSQVDG